MTRRTGKGQGRSRPEDLLPISPVVLEILLAVSDADRHGYAIMQGIAKRTEGAIRLQPGTLYRLLDRLVDQGLIEQSLHRPIAERDDERRRYYNLTPFGRAVAAAETARLQNVLQDARVRRLLRSNP